MHGISMELKPSDMKYIFGLSSHRVDIENKMYQQVVDMKLEEKLNIKVSSGKSVVEQLEKSLFAM